DFIFYWFQDAQLPDLDAQANKAGFRRNLFTNFLWNVTLVHGEEAPIRIWLILYSLSLHHLFCKGSAIHLATISGEI
ncbi:MAG: hypothetical protein KG029_03735, partial [Bacteroidetes bacterium]|nr:hypothetical protein [Bacteroidota bacterium]